MTALLAFSLQVLDPALSAIGLLGLLPFAAGAVALRRSRRAARALGLTPAALPPALAPAALATLACVSAAVAAAQPVVRTADERYSRTESEAFFLVDVSRSMLASSGSESPTRLDRARDVVGVLRASIPDVPAGLAGLTDRALPYLFPTTDGDAFRETLERSVMDETPPPQEVDTVATTFAAVPALVRDGFFTPGARYRTCVLVTDGEARTGDDPAVGGKALAGGRGCRVLVVRVGSTSDRIYLDSGRPETQYRPDAAAASKVSRLAEAAGGAAFTAEDVEGAVRTLREDAARGPTEAVTREATYHALAPYAAALAAILAVGVGVGRTVRRRPLRRGAATSLSRDRIGARA